MIMVLVTIAITMIYTHFSLDVLSVKLTSHTQSYDTDAHDKSSSEQQSSSPKLINTQQSKNSHHNLNKKTTFVKINISTVNEEIFVSV